MLKRNMKKRRLRVGSPRRVSHLLIVALAVGSMVGSTQMFMPEVAKPAFGHRYTMTV